MKNYEDLKTIMDENEDLFDGLVETGEYRFREWLKDNMKIYKYFVGFSKHLRRRKPQKYYSSRAIWEQIRWQTMVVEQPKSGPVFKLNNNYAPFVARLVMVAEPELEGMFQKRGRRE